MPEFIQIDEDIRLTAFFASDKENLLRYLNDAEIAHNTSHIPHPYTEQDADNWLALTRDNFEKYGRLTNWAIRHQTEGLIGGIGRMVKTGIDGHSDEIGYWLAAPFRRRGIMKTVVPALVDWLFANTPLIRIEARVFDYNTPSALLLEKTGFEREGIARKAQQKGDRFIDVILLARIKPD